MSKGPGWFQALSKPVQEVIEQTLHVLMGVGLGLTCTVLVVWWREFVQQAPIERLEDTGRDILFTLAGVTVGQIMLLGVVWALL
jgi:hypothetical protein